MIVRDESHVILECLDSIFEYIDYWVICDTGSEDDTAAIIQDYFAKKGIPGELHHHEWVDFGHNRSLALAQVKGKARYAWVIDADDYLVGTPDCSQLSHGSYDTLYRLGDNCAYWRRQIFRMDLQWSYKGVVHEFAYSDESSSHSRLQGSYHIAARSLGGTRNSAADKYARDVALLDRAHSLDPHDTRTVFYLAQSHYDHGNMQMAEHWYRKRVAMAGWPEEVFYAKLRIALALENQKAPFNHVRSALLDAWEFRPRRVEPLCHLARICRLQKNWNQAYLFAVQANASPYPSEDALFVDESVWHWRAQDEYAVSAYWIGRYEESAQLCRSLIESSFLPAHELPRIQENLQYATRAIAAL